MLTTKMTTGVLLPAAVTVVVQPLKRADRLERHVTIDVDEVHLHEVAVFRLLDDKCPLLVVAVVGRPSEHEAQSYGGTGRRPAGHVAPRRADRLPPAVMFYRRVHVDDQKLLRLTSGMCV